MWLARLEAWLLNLPKATPIGRIVIDKLPPSTRFALGLMEPTATAWWRTPETQCFCRTTSTSAHVDVERVAR